MLKVSNSRFPTVHTSSTSYQHEKVGEKVGENIDTSSICRQQFVNMFANCLLCEGCFIVFIPPQAKAAQATTGPKVITQKGLS